MVAGLFGVRRTPLSGENSGHDTNSDSLHPILYIETKYRQKHYAVELFKDTKKKALKEKKTPIVALKQAGTQGFLLLIDPSDLKTIAESVRRTKEKRRWRFKTRPPTKTKS